MNKCFLASSLEKKLEHEEIQPPSPIASAFTQRQVSGGLWVTVTRTWLGGAPSQAAEAEERITVKERKRYNGDV